MYVLKGTMKGNLQVKLDMLIEVGGIVRFLTISVAWVLFGGKYTSNKGSETIFYIFAFFMVCWPKNLKNKIS